MTKYLQPTFSVPSPNTDDYRTRYDAIDWGTPPASSLDDFDPDTSCLATEGKGHCGVCEMNNRWKCCRCGERLEVPK